MRQQTRKLAAIIGSTVVVIGLIATVSLKASAITNQMHAWKLLPQQERITELYFTNASNLPTTYDTGLTQTVAFTVHNLEYRTTTYHYTVTQLAQASNQQQLLAQGDVTLKQDQTTTLQAVVLVKDFGTSTIQVHLQTGETIAYPVTKAEQ